MRVPRVRLPRATRRARLGPLYAIAEAGSYLRVPENTVRSWVTGPSANFIEPPRRHFPRKRLLSVCISTGVSFWKRALPGSIRRDRKSIDQMVTLLALLDCDVRLTVRRKSA